MSKNLIEQNFNEALHLLQQFISKPENLDAIEKAGSILVEALKKILW